MGISSGLNLQEFKCEVVSKRHGASWSQLKVGKTRDAAQTKAGGKDVLKGALLDLKHLSPNPEP